MKTGGFKRTMVLGLAASALLLAGGCRDEGPRGVQEPRQESGENTGRQPDDLKQLPNQEGFQSVPEAHEAPSGIGLDGRGGSGLNQRTTGQEPEDLQRVPEQEGFQSVPEAHEAPSGIGLDGRGDGAERQDEPRQVD